MTYADNADGNVLEGNVEAMGTRNALVRSDEVLTTADAVLVAARFQVKRIAVKPGGVLSLQNHFYRAEHWVAMRGTAEVTLDGTVSQVHENESVYLPIGSAHRLANLARSSWS